MIVYDTCNIQRLAALLVLAVAFFTTASIFSPKSPETKISAFEQPYRHHSVVNHINLSVSSCNAPESIPPLYATTRNVPEAIRSYVEFHREGRACLIASANNTCENVPDIIVWDGKMALVGGFGDRMKSMRTLFMLAILTRRLYFIKWPYQSSTPYRLTAGFLPAYIDWRVPEELYEFSSRPDKTNITADIRPAGIDIDGNVRPEIPNFFPPPHEEPLFYPNETNFERAFANYSVIYVNFLFLQVQIIANFSKNVPLATRMIGLAGLKYMPLQRILTHTLFRPSPAVAYMARRRSFSRGVPYIAAHVRVGTDVMESLDERFTHLQEASALKELSKQFIRCIKRASIPDSNSSLFTYFSSNDLFETRNNEKQIRLFLASDTIALKDIFRQEAKESGIITRTVRRHGWHIDKGRSGLFGSNDSEHCLAFLDVFADAYALSEAKIVIYLKSGFPEVSFGMGNVQYWHLIDSKQPLGENECFVSNLSTVENTEYF